MKLNNLAFWLSELRSPLIEIQGYVFIDRDIDNSKEITERISEYDSIKKAQRWMNIVPLSDFFREICGDEWVIYKQDAEDIANIYASIFKERSKSQFPEKDIFVEIWRESDPFDIGITLFQR